jgi:hypothetical protein
MPAVPAGIPPHQEMNAVLHCPEVCSVFYNVSGTTLRDMGSINLMRSFSLSSMSITGILFSIKIGEEPTDEKSSSDDETHLTFVYGTFLNRMLKNDPIIVHALGLMS